MIDQLQDIAALSRHEGHPGVSIVHLSGTLDSHRAGGVRRAFGAVPAGARVVIDLARVSFIDSAGLGALIGGIRRIRESGGEVVIAGPRRSVDRLLALTGVSGLAPVAPGVDDALAVLAAPAEGREAR